MRLRWQASLIVLALTSGGCAAVSARACLPGTGRSPADRLWLDAHAAFAAGRYAEAEQRFDSLARTYPTTSAGREARFYAGMLRLDPRDPDWDPKVAEARLRDYLALARDSVAASPLYHAAEARALLELAVQLNLPAEERIAGLQPEPAAAPTRTVVRVVRATDNAALLQENQQLRQRLAEREAQLQQLEQELARIRRVLTPP